MYLINEEHVTFLQVSELPYQVAGNFYRGAGSRVQHCSHLMGDDIGESGLAKSRWAGKKNVVQSLFAIQGRLHVDAKVFFYLPLAYVVRELSWANSQFKLLLISTQRCIPCYSFRHTFCGATIRLRLSLNSSYTFASLRKLRRSIDSTEISPPSSNADVTAF